MKRTICALLLLPLLLSGCNFKMAAHLHPFMDPPEVQPAPQSATLRQCEYRNSGELL